MAPGPFSFRFDPVGDWMAWTRHELERAGYKLPFGAPPKAIARSWVNLQFRSIERKPRSVMVSRAFHCRSDERTAVDEIKRNARLGRDLNQFLSKNLRDAYYADRLLFDWGLHHLHLSTVLEPSGFVRRTTRLLFARVTDEAFFIVLIGTHGQWANSQMIETIHKNWPESIEPMRMTDMTARRQAFSDEERLKIRHAGGLLLTSTEDGSVYAPIGGGYATSGASVEVTMRFDKIISYLIGLGEYVRQQEQVIRTKCWQNGINPDLIHLRLLISESAPCAWDARYKFRVELPRPS